MFREKYGNLGSDEIIIASIKHNSSASRIVGFFEDYCKIQVEHKNLEKVPSIEELLSEETGRRLFGSPKLSLTTIQHEKYNQGILSYLKTRFPGITIKSSKLVADVAAFLPESEQNLFREKHGNLGSDQVVQSSVRHAGSASKIVELLEDYCKIQVEYNYLKKVPSIDELLTEETGKLLFEK